ncbi:MAG: hypothetical protein IK125_02260 [Lachnospiraceae bacterium]|nr:hypothetical protein [Lachnospiraceae bacterium]
MKKCAVNRVLSVFLSVIMLVAMLPLAGNGISAEAAAAAEKQVVCLGTTSIKAPVSGNTESAWTGSYVWFGKYDATPVRYRVLAPKTTAYGKTTMLLDCDRILYTAKYDQDKVANSGATAPNEWKYSDIRTGLNGSSFLNKDHGFTRTERNAIATSKIGSHALTVGTAAGNVSTWSKSVFGSTVALTGEKIFLLDAEEVSNINYGYPVSDGHTQRRIKYTVGGQKADWWLRSAENNDKERAGYVCDNGSLDPYDVNVGYGVSPALNVDLSSVIFSSLVSGKVGADNAEYKLTLKDTAMNVAITSGKTMTLSQTKVTIPYTITGDDASKATQVSVLILDKEYKAANSNGAKILMYKKLAVSGSFSATGAGTFTLPYDAGGWGSDYYVYLLAEDVNTECESDYASAPLKLAQPTGVKPYVFDQPMNMSEVPGETVTFTVQAFGAGTLSYQWQSRKDSSSAWTNSGQSGAKTRALTVSVTPGLNGWQFRCVVKNANGQTASNPATLSVVPKFHQQPYDEYSSEYDGTYFCVVASGKAPLTFQWQSRKNSSSAWKNVSNASAGEVSGAYYTYYNNGYTTGYKSEYSFQSTSELNGYQFRCVVTDGNGNKAYSKTALFVSQLTITSQPKNVSVETGTTAEFSVDVLGNAYTYQWQSRKDSSSPWASSAQKGAKTNRLEVSTTPGLNGWQFRCVVTQSKKEQVISDTVTLKVLPKITSKPSNTAVTLGDTATFSVSVTGKEPLKYVWQSRKNASATWANSAQKGAKTATLSVATTQGLHGWQFRCAVTDAYGQTLYTDPVTLSILPKITKQPEDMVVKDSTTVMFSTEAIGKGPLTYSLERRESYGWKTYITSTPNDPSHVDIGKFVTALDEGYYRVTVTDANGQTAISKAFYLEVE